MRTLIINYFVGIVMDILRELAERTDTTIDDKLVELLNENMSQIKQEIHFRF